MAKVKLYDIEGKETGNLTLDESLFNVAINHALVHEVVLAQEANSRQPLAHTKDRSDVQGSGKKPWKQKGTGRARHGSRRSPIWIGGGITFGPRKDRNFSKKVNRQARRKALAMVLTDKVQTNRFVAVEELAIPEGKTKQLMSILNRLPVADKKTLIVLNAEDISVARAARNIPRVETISSQSLNVQNLLAYDYMLVSKAAIDKLTETYRAEPGPASQDKLLPKADQPLVETPNR